MRHLVVLFIHFLATLVRLLGPGGTRMPVSIIFENLEAGANIDNIMEWFEGLDRDQIKAVIEFAARSLDETPSSAVSR